MSNKNKLIFKKIFFFIFRIKINDNHIINPKITDKVIPQTGIL